MSEWTGKAHAETREDYLDGNALAGPLSEVFSIDITAALGKCGACGAVRAVAQAHLYVDAPAKILRCPSCGGVLLRLDERGGRLILDLSGFAHLTIEVG
jgi:hypothetical protein